MILLANSTSNIDRSSGSLQTKSRLPLLVRGTACMCRSYFTSAGKPHHRICKNLINVFSDRVLKDQSPIIDSYADLTMTRLPMEIGKSPEGKVDVAEYLGYPTLNVIVDLTFGELFHSLKGNNEHSWILGFFLGAKFGSVRNSLSHYYPIDKIFEWTFL